jgi:hypothetical protein
MIEPYAFLSARFEKDVPKELSVLSIISQSFFQPFSLEDNLLVILTALTSGSGVGFNRVMLFLRENNRLRGEMWLGPRSPEEAASIWEILSTPSIGYYEIIEYNRSLIRNNADTLTGRMKNLSFGLAEASPVIPAMAALRKEILLVKEASRDPAVDRKFLDLIGMDEFLCIPLVSKDEVLGEIIADNAITRTPISLADIRLAGLCGLLAGNYISTARLYQKLMEAQKMAAMGEMAMFLSHQLRNPLVAIGGFVEQMLRPETPEEKKVRNLGIIREEIRRLEDIVFQMSHFLKVSMREPVWFDPWPTVEEVLKSPDLAGRAQAFNMDVSLERAEVEIFSDPVSFGEALRNIIDNAFDATGPGGTVSVRSYVKGKDWFTVSVRDTGQGITNPDKEQMFRPFFTTKEKGLGLGLVFVKRVMDACGGRVDFRSRPGRGTIFHLTFPCREKKAKEAP